VTKKKNLPSPPVHMSGKKHVPGVANPKSDVMKMANEARSKANAMSDQKREESFTLGMRLIYGGSNCVAAKTGRP